MSESPRSKKLSNELKALIESPLDLPDGSSFTSTPAKLTIEEMIALSERYLPIINSQPDFKERKRKEAFDVPFVL